MCEDVVLYLWILFFVYFIFCDGEVVSVLSLYFMKAACVSSVGQGWWGVLYVCIPLWWSGVQVVVWLEVTKQTIF